MKEIKVRLPQLYRMEKRGDDGCPKCGRGFKVGEKVLRTHAGANHHRRTRWRHKACVVYY